MAGVSVGESASQLLAMAGEYGFEITESQLRNWHLHGILPRPIQEHPLGIMGSQAIYPPGTGFQLIVLCNLHRQFPRSFKGCAQGLWWRGFSVEGTNGRERLRRLSAAYTKATKKLSRSILDNQIIDDPGNNQDFIKTLRNLRTSNSFFRQTRKRLGPRISEFLGLVRQIVDGDFRPWSEQPADDKDVIKDKLAADKALGLWRAKKDLQVELRPDLYADVEAILKAISRSIRKREIILMINKQSDEEIDNGRDELRTIFLAFLTAPESSIHKGSGLAVLRTFIQTLSYSDADLFLLFYLALKQDTAFRTSMQKVLKEFRAEAKKLDLRPEQIAFWKTWDPALARGLGLD